MFVYTTHGSEDLRGTRVPFHAYKMEEGLGVFVEVGILLCVCASTVHICV